MTLEHSTPPEAATRRELRERERAAAAATPRSAAPRDAAPHSPAPRSPAPLSPAPLSPTPRSAARRPASPRATAHRAPRGRRSLGSRILSTSALVAVGAIVVGMSLPANVLDSYAPTAAADTSLIAAVAVEDAQELSIDSLDPEAMTVSRDDFDVKSWAEVLRERYGSRNYSSYRVGNSGPIRWPFPYSVPISSGYGAREAACGACSTDHKGLDFVPGNGAPIYAIANGVVVEHSENHWSFGNSVVLRHSIDGQVVQTRYAHMQLSSSPLQVGDEVAVGDFIGLVGQTGVATAPHLHFEVIVNGGHVDPFPWLQAHAG